MLILAGCGGGGGSGKTEGEEAAGPAYTGLTEAAVLDEGNAPGLSLEVFNYASMNPDLGISGAWTLNQNYLLPPVGVSLNIREIFRGFVITPDDGISPESIDEEGQVISDGLGGSMTVTIDEESAGITSGKVVFRSYHSHGTIAGGTVGFSGSYDNDVDLFQVDLTFDTYEEKDGSCSFLYDGTASFSLDAARLFLKIDSVVEDSSSTVFRLNDYELNRVYEDGHAVVTLQGRYYDPGKGYVDLVTREPFLYENLAGFPYAGSLELTGKGGAKSLLLSVSPDTYRIQTDADGDGIFESQSDHAWN